jgi:hypothetical protein
VVSAAFAVWRSLFDERLNGAQLVGGVLILAGVASVRFG